MLHIITGLANGGAEGVLYRLTTADEGNDHHVISMGDSGLHGNQLAAAGIPVHTLDMPRGSVTVQGLITMYALVRRIDPDVVQTWMYRADLIGGAIARLAARRAVAWGIRASDAHRHSKGLAAKTLVWVCARCSRVVPTRIVFASNAGAAVHTRAGYSAPKSRVVPNGYDTALFAPNADSRRRQRADWGIGPNVTLLGMVARWDSLKDHGTLLAALQELARRATPAWSCVLVGSGMNAANSELVALLRQNVVRDRVMLVGPATDMSSVMNALDLHVLSSKSEAFPNVLAEAMACGTPCVTTDVGDTRVIVGSTGWVVPHSDPAALAGALQDALGEMTDATQWEKRRAACRSRILDEFSLQRMVAAYNLVWNEAVNEHARD